MRRHDHGEAGRGGNVARAARRSVGRASRSQAAALRCAAAVSTRPRSSRKRFRARHQLDHALVRFLRRRAEREDAVVHEHHADRARVRFRGELPRAQPREIEARHHVRDDDDVVAVDLAHVLSRRRRCSSPRAPRRRACGRRTCAAGSRAGSSRPTAPARRRASPASRARSSSAGRTALSSFASLREVARGAPGRNPASSIVSRSQPLPLTYRMSSSSPVTLGRRTLTDVLPPPCSTSV